MDYKKQFRKKIKHFYLLKEISKNLYLSYDEKLKQIRTIKIIQKHKDRNKLIQLKNELDDFINHKNINLLNILSYEASPNNIYLIYEYCNGGNLKYFLELYKERHKSDIDLKLIQKIILQIISGLEYLHNNKKVFDYLSLENIFINFDNHDNTEIDGLIKEEINLSNNILEEPFTIKINNSLYMNDKEEMMKDINIIKNMSPEIAKYIKDNDKITNLEFTYESDIWSLGTIIYEIIIGKPAFNGENIKEIIDNIITGKYHFPGEYHKCIHILTFINGFLQYFPKKRFSFDEIKNHSFLQKDPKDFFELDNIKNVANQNIEINTKDSENIMWGLLAYKKSSSNISDSNPIQINEEINNQNTNIEFKDKEEIEENKIIEIKEKEDNNENNLSNTIKEEDKKENENAIDNNNDDIINEFVFEEKKENEDKNFLKKRKNDKDKKEKNEKEENNFINEFEIINKYEGKKNNKKNQLGKSSFIEI